MDCHDGKYLRPRVARPVRRRVDSSAGDPRSSGISRAAPGIAAVFRNHGLVRVVASYAGFISVFSAAWIAMLVYAFNQGGATTAGLVAVAQLIPAALFAPFAGVLADRYSPAAVLLAGYLLQAAALAAVAVSLLS